MHIIRRPIIVNGKLIRPNKAMQARTESEKHGLYCQCDCCQIFWHTYKDGCNERLIVDLDAQNS